MRRTTLALAHLACTTIVPAMAGQAPCAASDPDIPVSHRDRVYSAEQFSNTVSVTDPVDNKLVGVIRQESEHLSMQIVFAIHEIELHPMEKCNDHQQVSVNGMDPYRYARNARHGSREFRS